MNSKIFKLFLFFSVTFQLYSQELLPFVENYSKLNYKGDNQIWNVVQGSDKAIYFANNSYLLRFDGVSWEKYSLPNKTIIRSIMVDGDRIYSGSYKEFGYWYRKEGKMNYVSISNKKEAFEDNENEEVWKIFKFNDIIYFQTFNEIYLYDGKVLRKTILPPLISYCFEIDKQLLVASVYEGVYRMVDSKIVKVKGWSALENKVIHAIEKYNGKIFFFTQKNGVFVSEKGVLIPWKNPLNDALKKENINVAKFVKSDKLVIGTGSNGVYIINLKDNSLINLNRNNILANNSVLSITQDQDNDLWLGLDNGIAHIEINSLTSIFYDSSGALGSVYSIVKTDKGYLMASNHGVFSYEKNCFSMIPNSQGQAWNITKIKDQYLIGHNDATFIYKKGKFSRLNDANGGWNLVKSNVNDCYLQGTYSGIIVFENPKDLSQTKRIEGLLKPIKYVAQNRKNEIWAADIYRGLYRIKYNDAYKTTKVENITQQSKIENDFGIKIFEFRNEILFLINNKWYNYNYVSNQLEVNKLFNSNFKNILDIISVDENHFVVLQEEVLYHIYANGNKFVWNPIQDKYYGGKIVKDNLRIFKDKDTYLLNLDDGFVSFQLNSKKSFNTIIKIEAFNNDNLVEEQSKINYNSEIKIKVISGVFGASKPNLFFKVNNAGDFKPLKEGLIVLNSLNSGSYIVSVFLHDGLNYSKVSSFEFEVASPWYFSFWMIFLYLLLVGVGLYLYYRWNKMRYIQKLALREEELKHQKMIFEMELQAENELNRQEYEKNILELEIKSKSSQVAGKSLSIAKQSEMIDNIQDILDTETDFNKLKSEIKKAIKINSVNKNEWESFETNLNQIHNEFIINLTKKYPNLTSKDIKLCIYLKMNLSSKEIAPMMNISFRGVELQRYRLRKKLNLTQEESLSKFLLMV